MAESSSNSRNPVSYKKLHDDLENQRSHTPGMRRHSYKANTRAKMSALSMTMTAKKQMVYVLSHTVQREGDIGSFNYLLQPFLIRWNYGTQWMWENYLSGSSIWTTKTIQDHQNTGKQLIRSRYLGHVTGYQSIRDRIS
eukprot:sb/3474408/